MVAKSVPNIHQ